MCMVEGVGCFLVSLLFARNPYDNMQHLMLDLSVCLNQDDESTHEHMAKELRSECTALIFVDLERGYKQ